MVWSTKLLPDPRRRYSARDLAKELGVEEALVLDALNVIGEYVSSTSRKSIEEPIRRRLYEHFDRAYSPPAVLQVSSWERQDQATPSRTPHTPRNKPRPRGPDRSRTEFQPKDASVGLGSQSDDVAPSWEDASWELLGFTQPERDAWCVFLRRGQAKEAAALRNAGFLPEDLGVELLGWPVWRRLRAGESQREVKRLLDRHRQGNAEATG